MNISLSEMAAIAMPLGRLSPWFDVALESALAQTVQVPVYLVANGLQPFELEHLQELAANHELIKLCIFEERVSLYQNWNRILELVKEPLFGMLHDDDILEPWAMEELLKLAVKWPQKGIYLSNERLINEDGVFYQQRSVKSLGDSCQLGRNEILRWAITNRICATGFLIDRKRARESGGYSDDLPFTADWNMYFKVGSLYGACFGDFDSGRYRFSGKTGQSSSSLARGGRSLLEYRRQQFLNLELLGIKPIDCEIEQKISLAGFAKIIIKYFHETLGDDGKLVVKEALTDGLMMKRLQWFKTLVGEHACRMVASTIILLKYPQIRK